MTLFDFIKESPFIALVFLYFFMAGIESIVKAWRNK